MKRTLLGLMLEYIFGAAKRSTPIESASGKTLIEFELDPTRWAVVIVLIRGHCT
jgi:hypothetical protein